MIRQHAHDPQAERIIDNAVSAKDDALKVLTDMKHYSTEECKAALQKYIKTFKNRKDKVLYYFSFVESILDQKDQLDFRFISLASASYGKAMDLLSKDKTLWDEMLDRSYEIACRFYDMGTGEAAFQAVDYYRRVKRSFD